MLKNALWKSLDKVRIRIRTDPHRTGSLDPKQRENQRETAPVLNKKAVLWIRNHLVRLLPFKPGQLNNWQILDVHSVADPDPGSGAFFDPGSGMGKKPRSGSGMNILDHIYEILEIIFGVKITEIP